MTNEIIFKTRVDTGTTSKDLAAISTELGKIDEGTKTVGKDSAAQLEALNKKIAEGGMSARELSRSVNEYMTIARDAGRTSPVGQAAIAEAAKLTDELGDLRNEIKRASHDGANMQAALQLGSTIVAGYGAAKGAMSLLGVESESVEKAQQKLIAVTATLNGLEQIRSALEKESFLMQKAKIVQTTALTAATALYATVVGTSTGAMRLFRIALASTGIGAIIVGVGLLIANFEKLTDAVKWFTDLFADSSEKEKQAMFEVQQAKRKQVDAAILANQQQQDSINDSYDFEIAKAKAAGKDTSKIEKEKRDAMRKTLQEQIKNFELSLRLNVANVKEVQRLMNEIEKTRKDLLALEQQDKLAAITETTNAQKKASDKEKQRLKEEAEEKKKAIDYQRALEDYLIKSLGDSDVARRMQIQLNHQRELEELTAKYGKESQIIKDAKIAQAGELAKFDAEATKAREDKENADAAKLREIQNRNDKAGLEAKLLGIQEDWKAEMAVKQMLAELERDQALQNTDLTENEKLLIKAQYTEKLRQLEKEDSDRSIELAKKEREAINEIMENGMKSIQGLSDAIFTIKLANAKKGSEEELRIQKKQFELNKAMQLGTAVINGIQSILAITSVPDFTLGVQTALRIGAQVALNAASIAKIASQRFEGGAPSPFTPPAIPQVGAPDIAQAQQPQAQGTQTAGLVNRPNKVVVVDSEIKAVMDSSQQIEVVSSFGG